MFKTSQSAGPLYAWLGVCVLTAASVSWAQSDPAEGADSPDAEALDDAVGPKEGSGDVAPSAKGPAAEEGASAAQPEAEVELETEDETYSHGAYDDAYGDDDGYYERDRRRSPEGRTDDAAERRDRADGERASSNDGEPNTDRGPPADGAAGNVDGKNDRILMGGIVTGLVVRFFPIYLLDYLVGPFAGQWAVNEFTDSPLEYRTSTKLAGAGAMFCFDVVSFGAAGLVATMALVIGNLLASGIGGACFACTFGGCAMIPLFSVGFVGMWVMEWLDAGQAPSTVKPASEPAPRRRRRRRSEIEVPRGPRVAQAMSY